MKTNTTKLTLAVAAFSVATSAFAQEAEKPVNVNTQGLPDHLKARIEQKAQEGQTSLIRYLNSTRHIHNLRVEFIVKPDDPAAMAKAKGEPRKVADRSEAAK
jgi:hypothetical protein